MIASQLILTKLGFTGKSVNDGGEARYKIEITKATENEFEATATSLVDFNGNGVFNQWKVTHDGNVIQILAD